MLKVYQHWFVEKNLEVIEFLFNFQVLNNVKELCEIIYSILYSLSGAGNGR